MSTNKCGALGREEGRLTNLPVHLVKHIVLWHIVHVLLVLLDFNIHLLKWKDNAGIIEQIPKAEISPPDRIAVREACGRCARSNQAVDRSSRACLGFCVVPCFCELVSPFCLLSVELGLVSASCRRGKVNIET